MTKCNPSWLREICNAWSTREVRTPHKTLLESGGDLKRDNISQYIVHDRTVGRCFAVLPTLDSTRPEPRTDLRLSNANGQIGVAIGAPVLVLQGPSAICHLPLSADMESYRSRYPVLPNPKLGQPHQHTTQYDTSRPCL